MLMDTADISSSMLVDILGNEGFGGTEESKGEEKSNNADVQQQVVDPLNRCSLTAPVPQSLPPPPHSLPNKNPQVLPKELFYRNDSFIDNQQEFYKKTDSLTPKKVVETPKILSSPSSKAALGSSKQKIMNKKERVPPLKMCFQGIELELPHGEGTRLDIKPDGSLRLRLHNFSGDVTLKKIQPSALSASMRVDNTISQQAQEWRRQSFIKSTRITTISEQEPTEKCSIHQEKNSISPPCFGGDEEKKQANEKTPKQHKIKKSTALSQTAASHKWSPLRSPSEVGQSATIDTVQSVDDFVFFGSFPKESKDQVEERPESFCSESEEIYKANNNNLSQNHTPSISTKSSPSRHHENTEQSNDRPLPPGWERRFDPQKKKFYYIDHTNRTTTWQHPNRLSSSTTTPATGIRKSDNFTNQFSHSIHNKSHIS